MTTRQPRAFSDLPIPPGEVLAEEIEARQMTQRELAARLGRPTQAINEIIKAKKAITPDTAIGLEKALGIYAQFWVNLESDYRMTLARNRERDTLAASVEWLNHYPIRDMMKRGWIQAGRDRLSKLEALLSFLGVASAEPRAYQQAVGFRMTEAAQNRISPGALAVWLRKGELHALEASTRKYDERVFKRALDRIRQMTELPPSAFIPAMSRLCADAGVVFCMVQELPKSGANGATRWLSGRKALIQMSNRNKWADVFWFTFFHEACHVLKHRTHRRIVIDGIGEDPEMVEIEAEANRFARDFLIPPGAWRDFCDADDFAAGSITAFARSARIAPFIVVGRLQREEKIGYNRLAHLKVRYEWVADSGK